jgi:hypothetical protein
MTTTARAPSTTHTESVAVRMARVTWYRHRGALAGIAALFAVAVVVLLAEGLTMRHTLGGLSRCLVTDAQGSVCVHTPAWDGFGIRPYYVDDLSQGLNVLPLLAAMFAGVPWLTREFETGSFRYTWVQGIGRRDWLLGTFAPLAVAAAAAAAVAGLVYDWWYQVAQWASAAFPYGGWSWVPFGLVPEVFVAWTVFGMALALLVALLVRRTVPAMAACAAGFIAVYVAVNWPLRDRLLSQAPVIARVKFSYAAAPSWNDLFLRGWLAGPSGRPAGSAVINRLYNMTGPQADRWIAQHHYAYWIAYQPHDRLQLFQFATAAILLAAAAALTLAATWLLRRHPPELPRTVLRLTTRAGASWRGTGTTTRSVQIFFIYQNGRWLYGPHWADGPGGKGGAGRFDDDGGRGCRLSQMTEPRVLSYALARGLPNAKRGEGRCTGLVRWRAPTRLRRCWSAGMPSSRSCRRPSTAWPSAAAPCGSPGTPGWARARCCGPASSWPSPAATPR